MITPRINKQRPPTVNTPPVFSSDEMNIITDKGKYSYDESMTRTAIDLSKYFGYNEYGDIILMATKEQLTQDLGITEEQALELLAISDLGARKYNFRGFVGVYLNLGPQVRKMNGWAAGVFAGGYVGWYAKQLAATGPWGAGAAALITASTAATVKWAVENGIRTVPIGKNIPGYNYSFSVNIP